MPCLFDQLQLSLNDNIGLNQDRAKDLDNAREAHDASP